MKNFIPSNRSRNDLLPTHFSTSKTPSRIRGREICCLALSSAVLFAIGYTTRNFFSQTVTSPLIPPSLEGRISEITSGADTIICPYWNSFSVSFKGPNNEPYLTHCQNGIFSYIVSEETQKNPGIHYGSCVKEDADFAEMDIDCVSTLLLQKDADDGITSPDDLDDQVLFFGPDCTDDEWHQAPCSEIYPNDPRYAPRGSGNQN